MFTLVWDEDEMTAISMRQKPLALCPSLVKIGSG